MIRPGIQLLAVVLLITTVGLVHLAAKAIVAEGFGIIALIIIFAALPKLSHYLD